MFMAKDAFPDDIPQQFRTEYTTLEFEEFASSQADFQNLIDGFPQPLPLKTFCDSDVVATEAAYAMSLQWEEAARANAEFERERSEFLKEKDKFERAKSSIGTSMQMLREERDSALVGKDKALKKIEDLLSYNEKLI
ncbi:hypothetical protein LIER_11953 [Lithospermum erythrorhizon]|uniref:Uncharacterized protein n=1 Tax=Lithospermum erythrorhizon TaxID=34254 RepID=A0AAV3PSA9_LITER